MELAPTLPTARLLLCLNAKRVSSSDNVSVINNNVIRQRPYCSPTLFPIRVSPFSFSGVAVADVKPTATPSKGVFRVILIIETLVRVSTTLFTNTQY
jgi:hypothetical protein